MNRYYAPIFLLAVSALSAADVAAEKLMPDSLLDWRYVSDPRWSPNGEFLAYVRTRTDKEGVSYNSDIWLLDSTRVERALTASAGSDLAPRWSPDGRALAFISHRRGSAQVFVLPMNGGEARQLTDIAGSVSSIAWSPDGTRLAIRMREKNAERTEGALKPAFVTDRLDLRSDGRAGYRPKNRQRIAVVEFGRDWPAAATTVTDGAFDDGAPEWSHDGAYLYFSAVRKDRDDRVAEDTEIYRVPADGSGPPEPVTSRAGPDNSPLPSPDGKWLAVVGFAETDPPASYKPTDLRLIDLSGAGDARELTQDWDYGVGDSMAGDVNAPASGGARVQWAADGSALFFTAANRGQVQLMRADISTASVTAVTSFDAGELREFDVSATGTVAAVFSRPDVPADLVSFAVAAGSRGAWRQLTSVNRDLLRGVDLAVYEEVEVTSLDAIPIQAWLIRPASLDRRRRYPLIVYIHGGPHGMYGMNFFHEFQVLAAAGYVVVIANPRGSTGYGGEFGNSIQYKYPGQDFDDLMAVTDAVQERRYVDETRVGVAGGSGGGLLTTWIVGKTDRFKAASAHRSVTNWYSFVGTADYNVYFTDHWFRDFPWRDADAYLARSPISLVDNVKTPVQLIHSDTDFRTPLEQGLQYFTALRMLDKPSELVVFPGESHGLSRVGKPAHRVERLQHVLRWFDKHLKN